MEWFPWKYATIQLISSASGKQFIVPSAGFVGDISCDLYNFAFKEIF